MWNWECNIEDEIKREDDEIKGTDWFTGNWVDGYRAPDLWMEQVLWTVYLSGFVWGIGYLVLLPLGFFAYFGWMQLWSLVGLYEMLFEGRDFLLYFDGPFRRFAMGSFIYTLAVLLLWIPGLNFILSPLFGWWALLDYYDYKYELPI